MSTTVDPERLETMWDALVQKREDVSEAEGEFEKAREKAKTAKTRLDALQAEFIQMFDRYNRTKRGDVVDLPLFAQADQVEEAINRPETKMVVELLGSVGYTCDPLVAAGFTEAERNEIRTWVSAVLDARVAAEKPDATIADLPGIPAMPGFLVRPEDEVAKPAGDPLVERFGADQAEKLRPLLTDASLLRALLLDVLGEKKAPAEDLINFWDADDRLDVVIYAAARRLARQEHAAGGEKVKVPAKPRVLGGRGSNVVDFGTSQKIDGEALVEDAGAAEVVDVPSGEVAVETAADAAPAVEEERPEAETRTRPKKTRPLPGAKKAARTVPAKAAKKAGGRKR